MNVDTERIKKLFLNSQLSGFLLTEVIGDGEKGVVFLGEKRGPITDAKAIKVIPSQLATTGWENEVIKVNRLGPRPGVPRYINHGKEIRDNNEYVWIIWDLIKGKSLKHLIEENNLTVLIIRDVILQTLSILFACNQVDFQHGDLHSGNILIADSDPLDIDPNQRKIWVIDFGFKTSSLIRQDDQLLDDYIGLNRILQDALRTIDFHTLDGEEKILFKVLRDQFSKFLLETDPTQENQKEKARRLHNRLFELVNEFKNTSVRQSKGVGDYLAAELIGDRYDEWKSLFVSDFLAANKLVDQNTVLFTGLRGCGKTMAFRRLTAIFDLELGNSDLNPTGEFIGFYANARNLAEAFPWLPSKHQHLAGPQIIHYFHLIYLIEIFTWLHELQKRNIQPIKNSAVIDFVNEKFGKELIITGNTSLGLSHILHFLRNKIQESKLNGHYKTKKWALSNIDFLDEALTMLKAAVGAPTGKRIFLFLDDYSSPLVNTTMQEILNPIAFRRSSHSVFKISTESIYSFHPVGLNQKRLEEDHDYKLVDLGTEVILQNNSEIERFIENVFRPRIERHSLLQNRELTLKSILGPSKSFNQIAREIANQKSVTSYYGNNVFCSLWSSNLRELISAFAKMIELSNRENLAKANTPIVDPENQSKVLKDEGGRFLHSLNSATSPLGSPPISTNELTYGEHLGAFARSFHEISKYELLQKTSKNQGSSPQKQARRIELYKVGNLPDDLKEIYQGLIRYGVLIRDSRGKSVRGLIVPRHHIRGILIPYFGISPSGRDSISISWEQFCEWLRNPLEFSNRWRKGALESQPELPYANQ